MDDRRTAILLDSLGSAPIKDDRALMEHPFFGLQKRPMTSPMVYDRGDVRIEVHPGPKGIATIWDKDVLIYVASLINDRIERGLPVNRTVRFAPHDLLLLTQRGTGKRAYGLLQDALFRLRSTTIVTSIRSGATKSEGGFGWLDDWNVIRRDQADATSSMIAVEVTIGRWLFDAIVQDRRVLTIDQAYFTLDRSLSRRLYELARKHVGSQEKWEIGLAKLAEKVGTTMTLKAFKLELVGIIEVDEIPSYRIELEIPLGRRGTLERAIVRFAPRDPVDM